MMAAHRMPSLTLSAKVKDSERRAWRVRGTFAELLTAETVDDGLSKAPSLLSFVRPCIPLRFDAGWSSSSVVEVPSG